MNPPLFAALAFALTTTLATALPASTPPPAAAVAQQPADSQKEFNFAKNPDAMLQEQARVIFKQAREVLDAHPPSAMPDDERQLALLALDSLLHDTRLDKGAAFTGFMEGTAKRVAEKLAGPKPAVPLRIIRFYNHGFILQTPSVTLAIDIVRGGKNVITGVEEQPFLDEKFMRPIVGRCDALFISHPHNDHADLRVAKLFLDAGKPVVAPPGLWEDVSPRIIRPRAADATAPIDFTLALPSLRTPLTVRAYPGHQGRALNNLYAITTPEEKTILHSGDQDGGGADLPWLLKIHEQQRVDVFLPQCWMSRLPLVVKGVAPALVLPGHENEMGHTVDHRESYWQTMRRVQNLSAPVIITAWGEHVDVP